MSIDILDILSAAPPFEGSTFTGVVINPPVKLDLIGRVWLVSWSYVPEPEEGETITFYVYRDGELLTPAGTTATSMTFTVGPGESPVIEVLAEGQDLLPLEPYPTRLTLTWASDPDIQLDYFLVEEETAPGSDEWLTRARVSDIGLGYYRWRSRVLEDSTTHSFRVTAVDAMGNESTAAALAALMVRIPDVPAVDFAYDAETGEVTVSE